MGEPTLKLVHSRAPYQSKYPHECPKWKHIWDNCPPEEELRINHAYRLGSDESPEFVRLVKWSNAEPPRNIEWAGELPSTENYEGTRYNDATPCTCGRPDEWKCYWRHHNLFVVGQDRAMPTAHALGLTEDERRRLRKARVKVRFIAYPGSPAIDRLIQNAVAFFGISTLPDEDVEVAGDDAEKDLTALFESPVRLVEDLSEEEAKQEVRQKMVAALPAGYSGLAENDPLRYPRTRYYVPNFRFRSVCAHVSEVVRRIKVDMERNPAQYLKYAITGAIKEALHREESPVDFPAHQVKGAKFPHPNVMSSGAFESEEILWAMLFDPTGKHEGVHRQTGFLNDWDGFTPERPDADHNDDTTNWDDVPNTTPTTDSNDQ